MRAHIAKEIVFPSKVLLAGCLLFFYAACSSLVDTQQTGIAANLGPTDGFPSGLVGFHFVVLERDLEHPEYPNEPLEARTEVWSDIARKGALPVTKLILLTPGFYDVHATPCSGFTLEGDVEVCVPLEQCSPAFATGDGGGIEVVPGEVVAVGPDDGLISQCIGDDGTVIVSPGFNQPPIFDSTRSMNTGCSEVEVCVRAYDNQDHPIAMQWPLHPALNVRPRPIVSIGTVEVGSAQVRLWEGCAEFATTTVGNFPGLEVTIRDQLADGRFLEDVIPSGRTSRTRQPLDTLSFTCAQ